VLPEQTAEDSIWQEWLFLYLDECRRRLQPAELHELATFLEAVQATRPALSSRTAAEGRFLIEFLARVADRSRRSALAAEAAVDLRRAAKTAPH